MLVDFPLVMIVQLQDELPVPGLLDLESDVVHALPSLSTKQKSPAAQCNKASVGILATLYFEWGCNSLKSNPLGS
jgi:hypothetical protein